MSVTPLDTAEIERRVAELRGGELATELPVSEPAPAYEHTRSLGEATQAFIDVVENPGVRFMLGLTPIDTLTRGFGPRELVMLTGFSFAGKTQVALTAIVNSPTRRVLFFSFDDPAEMIAFKLLCMHTGEDAEALEKRLREHDAGARTLLAEAERHFPNLLICDTPVGFTSMSRAIDEATNRWGAPPECMVLDYLSLVPTANTGDSGNFNIQSKAQELKRLTKDTDWPTICLHQGTRSGAKPGSPITLLSMAYGGEQEATFLLGAHRKRDDESLAASERQFHEDTISLSVVKSKRPPAKRTPPGGIDFYLHPITGLIRPLRDSDHRPHTRNASAAQAAAQAAQPALSRELGAEMIEDNEINKEWYS
jgi:hypothetical protein